MMIELVVQSIHILHLCTRVFSWEHAFHLIVDIYLCNMWIQRQFGSHQCTLQRDLCNDGVDDATCADNSGLFLLIQMETWKIAFICQLIL